MEWLAFALAFSSVSISPSLGQGPAPDPTPAPIVQLKGAYPYGEPLCATVLPDHRRALVAQGATIAVVDPRTFDASGEPVAIGYAEIPQISPMAMKYQKAPDTNHRLFIAGGTTGLWRIDLCQDLFGPTANVCRPDEHLLDRVGCENAFLYKWCVDVAPPGGPSGSGCG